MATTMNQAKAIRQLYPLVTVSSRTRHRIAMARSLFATQRAATRAGNLPKVVQRWSRGSDLRLLRLTMDGLPDRHIWGATPCVKPNLNSETDIKLVRH